MNDSQGLNLIYLVLLVVLVGSALASRRLPAGKTLRLAFAWVAIFAAGFLLMSLLVRS